MATGGHEIDPVPQTTTEADELGQMLKSLQDLDEGKVSQLTDSEKLIHGVMHDPDYTTQPRQVMLGKIPSSTYMKSMFQQAGQLYGALLEKDGLMYGSVKSLLLKNLVESGPHILPPSKKLNLMATLSEAIMKKKITGPSVINLADDMLSNMSQAEKEKFISFAMRHKPTKKSLNRDVRGHMTDPLQSSQIPVQLTKGLIFDFEAAKQKPTNAFYYHMHHFVANGLISEGKEKGHVIDTVVMAPYSAIYLNEVYNILDGTLTRYKNSRQMRAAFFVATTMTKYPMLWMNLIKEAKGGPPGVAESLMDFKEQVNSGIITRPDISDQALEIQVPKLTEWLGKGPEVQRWKNDIANLVIEICRDTKAESEGGKYPIKPNMTTDLGEHFDIDSFLRVHSSGFNFHELYDPENFSLMRHVMSGFRNHKALLRKAISNSSGQQKRHLQFLEDILLRQAILDRGRETTLLAHELIGKTGRRVRIKQILGEEGSYVWPETSSTSTEQDVGLLKVEKDPIYVYNLVEGRFHKGPVGLADRHIPVVSHHSSVWPKEDRVYQSLYTLDSLRRSEKNTSIQGLINAWIRVTGRRTGSRNVSIEETQQNNKILWQIKSWFKTYREKDMEIYVTPQGEFSDVEKYGSIPFDARKYDYSLDEREDLYNIVKVIGSSEDTKNLINFAKPTTYIQADGKLTEDQRGPVMPFIPEVLPYSFTVSKLADYNRYGGVPFFTEFRLPHEQRGEAPPMHPPLEAVEYEDRLRRESQLKDRPELILEQLSEHVGTQLNPRGSGKCKGMFRAQRWKRTRTQ